MILIEAITAVLQIGWTMLMRVRFPGSEIPIAIIIVGAFVIAFGIRIFAFTMGMSINVGETSRRSEKMAKVSKKKSS
jgi:hypothetical protein